MKWGMIFALEGERIMDFMDGKGAEQVISDYIEREMSEYRRASEQELAVGCIAPEAREAFYRKPYYSAGGFFFKKPVLKK